MSCVVDSNCESLESCDIKSDWQGVNSLFCKKKLNNVLKTSLSKNLLNVGRRLIGPYLLTRCVDFFV